MSYPVLPPFSTSFGDGRPISPVSTTSTAEGTAGPDLSSIYRTFDDSRDDNVSLELFSKHWVRVCNLNASMTTAKLREVFAPFGGNEVFVRLDDNGRAVGFVGFERNEEADRAMEQFQRTSSLHPESSVTLTRTAMDEVLAGRISSSLHSSVVSTSFDNTWSATGGSSASRFTVTSSLSRSTPQVVQPAPVSVSPSTSRAALVNLIAQASKVSECALRIVDEVRRAPPQTVQRLVHVLGEIPPSTCNMQAFREELTKQLLYELVRRDQRSVEGTRQCGAFLGELFVVQFLTGDPFELAASVLHRGVHVVAQVEGICAFAQACSRMRYPISKAAFWALADELAKMHLTQNERNSNTIAVGRALAGNIAAMRANEPRTVSTLAPRHAPIPPSIAAVFSDSAPSPLVTISRPVAPIPIRSDDPRQRTVYVSHLPPELPQNQLMAILSHGGTVNKVRVCRERGFATLFAFAEMATRENAEVLMKLNCLTLMGRIVLFQSARSPIQDVRPEDAIIGSSNVRLHHCRFGTTSAPLSDLVDNAAPEGSPMLPY